MKEWRAHHAAKMLAADEAWTMSAGEAGSEKTPARQRREQTGDTEQRGKLVVRSDQMRSGSGTAELAVSV